MRTALRTPQFAIFDDFLPKSGYTRLWKEMRNEDYNFVNAERWERVYGLLDGRPLEGSPVTCGSALAGTALFPTGRAIDVVIRTVLIRARLLKPWIGTRGRDWSSVTVRPFLYPQGTGLGWHDDGGQSGAFTLYVHPEWDPAWGGEILIGTDFQSGRISRQAFSLFDERSPSVDSTTLGYFVIPVPNRLVVIKGGTPHRINRVARSAGVSVRCSIAGFFG